jgi:hypothetical protein
VTGRRSIGACLALALLVLPACRGNSGAPTTGQTGTPATATVRPGGDVTLAPGGTARLDGGTALAVTFVGVPTDSRCPTSSHIACVWAGDAVVTVLVTAPASGPATRHELHATPPLATSITTRGHEISLLRLAPPRRSTAPIDPTAYRATLRITPR